MCDLDDRYDDYDQYEYGAPPCLLCRKASKPVGAVGQIRCGGVAEAFALCEACAVDPERNRKIAAIHPEAAAALGAT